MNIDAMTILLLLVFFALLVGAVLLVRGSDGRLGNGPVAPSAPGPSGPNGGAEPLAAYLDRMTAELALPATDVAEVRAELADHLADSIASLEADGFDRETAIREALGRLGPAAELGRQIRAAHQSTRRLLAGAGGGVFAAGGGVVLGFIGGCFVVAALAVAVSAAVAGLAAIGLHLPDLLVDANPIAGNSMLVTLALAVAAWVATRSAVRTSASVSHRLPRSIAVAWAVAGGLAFGWWAFFGLRGYQDWHTIAAELCVPVAAVAGALVWIDRPLPRASLPAVVVALIAVIVVPLVIFAPVRLAGSSEPVAVQAQAIGSQTVDFHLDTVAPMAPAAWLPEENILTAESGGDWASGATTVEAGVSGQAALQPILAKWRNLRFEAWHGLPGDVAGPGGVDPSYTSPFEIEPAAFNGDSLGATFHFERFRNARPWWVVLTGVAPDGNRYRLEQFGSGGSSDFRGSAWDWLTAPQ